MSQRDEKVGAQEAASEVVLVPDADHCIETVARNEYRRCVAACLRSPAPGPELCTRLETLRQFLEQADFGVLRHRSGPLVTAGRAVRFVLRPGTPGTVWRMEADSAEEEPA